MLPLARRAGAKGGEDMRVRATKAVAVAGVLLGSKDSVTIMEHAFNNCTNLTDYESIPSNWR